MIHYEGFHGTSSRCHVVHRCLDDRILFAFGIIEDGGPSPTNMIEELAVETATRKRFGGFTWSSQHLGERGWDGRSEAASRSCWVRYVEVTGAARSCAT